MRIGNILNFQDLENSIKNTDIIFHFAALADLDEALHKPIETVTNNILATVSILELSKKYNIKRIIYASSIYSMSLQGGFYRCSKKAAEDYIEEYYKRYGLNFTILRYGSLYGPRAQHWNGLNSFITQIVQNGKLEYFGTGEEKREYIHVEDAARASVTALGEDFRNQSVILTGQETMRVKDLLKMLSEILGISQDPRFIEAELHGHYIRTPYAYQPKLGRKYVPPIHVDLGQGLLQLIEEVQKNTLK